ncbi:hypothetical protein AJ78_01581 [Emergomyces pasteurianus Ep9510]|uniref:Uncharacterized protein n=1 Tax=Emergomyces pasteurianus Ep9510 TaxID=1447872 RepID=A0A1J9PPP1_9EURO|nr:hypothetical protein AJ78_01581 [Emergomyces pasteurianus Ep9510]
MIWRRLAARLESLDHFVAKDEGPARLASIVRGRTVKLKTFLGRDPGEQATLSPSTFESLSAFRGCYPHRNQAKAIEYVAYRSDALQTRYQQRWNGRT